MKHRVACAWMVVLVSLLLVLTLAGCGSQNPFVVLDWAGYEQEVFWQQFKEQHPDITPEYVFFADDAEAFAKLQSGFVADLVHPNSSWLELLVDSDLIQPVDTAKLSNWPGVMESLAKVGELDGKQYLVPWEWGYYSITVRTDKVQEVPDSWADLWDPQYAGHVSIYDSAEPAVLMAATVLGFDPWNLSEEQLEAVKQKLIELKPNLLGYWTDYTEINQQIASGEVWLGANTWPDCYVAVKAEGLLVEYITPQEGRLGWVYGYAIPTSAENPDLAHDYMDALLDVNSMAEMANQYGYGAASSAVVALTDPELVRLLNLDQPDLFLTTIFMKSLTEEQRQTWTTLWDEVKAAP